MLGLSQHPSLGPVESGPCHLQLQKDFQERDPFAMGNIQSPQLRTLDIYQRSGLLQAGALCRWLQVKDWRYGE